MKITSLVSLLTGLVVVGTVAIKEFNKEEPVNMDPFKRPANITEILSEEHYVNLSTKANKYNFEKFGISTEFDKKTNTLYLGNYTQNWNKQDWKGNMKKVPAYAKHTRISPFSKTFLLHPLEVKISNMEQRIYLVPQYTWDKETKPYEKHENAQKLIEGGKKIINGITGEIPIPFFKDFFNDWMKSVRTKDKRKIEKMTELIKKGYIATIIPSHIKHKLVGSTETAREYKIQFDTSKLKKEVPIYILTKIILGDSTKAPHGSFPNKYGELETKTIEFKLNYMEKQVEISKKKNPLEKKIKLVFVASENSKRGIFIMDEDGNNKKFVYHEQSFVGAENPKLSPDGSKILFEEKNQIYVINSNGKNLRKLTKRHMGYINCVSWSHDGKRILFGGESQKENPEIYLINSEDGKQINLTNSKKFRELCPSWSPDEKKILFKGSLRRNHSEIYVMNSDGSGRKKLTNNNRNDKGASWSPDGKKILFDKSLRKSNREIYVMNSDGSGQRNLTNLPGDDWNPAWSPDGKKILFTRRLGKPYKSNYEIYVMNSDGSNKKNLTNHPGRDTQASWSPNMEKILFNSNRTDKDYHSVNSYSDYHFMESDGSGQRKIDEESKYIDDASWQPVNKK